MARFGKIDKGDLAIFGNIWQDMTRGTWQDLIRFDKGVKTRFGKMWQDLTRGTWQDLVRCGKI